MPGPTRITQADLERYFDPKWVRRLFSDDGSGSPGGRLAASCERASRRAESILRRAWSSEEQLDALYAEDALVVAETCRLAMAYGAEGKAEWTGQGKPLEGAEKFALSALKELADGEARSRAEQLGAGANPRVSGNISAPQGDRCQYMFAPSRSNPRRGGY